LGEDGLVGLTDASRKALAAAEFVFGGPRHLALAGIARPKAQEWPLPFSVAPVLALRGRRVAVLASGDPFWFGAGGSLMPHLAPQEWQSFPMPSTFALAANHLGWRLEDTRCFGLHAAPFAMLRPCLIKGARLICLLRGGEAPAELATWLTDQGAGASTLHLLEALGGPRARYRTTRADRFDITECAPPVAMAVEVSASVGLPNSAGLPEDSFCHDGQITKSPIRALTLSALAPRRGELLWDIGAGSGSVSVEWCLAGGRALALEPRSDRLANINQNIARFGLAQQMQAVEGAVSGGKLPQTLADSGPPNAVFIGGGGDAALLETLFATMPKATRLVMNAVTLETEALLVLWQALKGGSLMRVELAHASPLGKMRGWSPTRAVVQWSVLL
jgi:precorrin-6Y C5,15-methyltransferase (decarboxylating)